MRQVKLTRYQVAHWSGKDAGNRSMRAAQRRIWNEQDYRIAADEMNRILDAGGFNGADTLEEQREEV
jgi:hypothetical protein